MTKTAEERLDFQSKLPFFNHTAGPLNQYTCERTGCGQSFFSVDPLENPTAPCPWCQKVSRVPV